MVVSIESESSVKRVVTLYNRASKLMIKINPSGTVTTGDSFDKFDLLVLESVDYDGKLTIYGNESARYLCFNPRGKLIGLRTAVGRPSCIFTEEMGPGGYYQYHTLVGKTEKYLGFTRDGKQLRNRKPCLPKCLEWLKFGFNDEVKYHNTKLSGIKVSPDALNRGMAVEKNRRRHNHGPRRSASLNPSSNFHVRLNAGV